MITAVQTENIELELSAVIVSVNGFDTPEVLVIKDEKGVAQLPAGPFDPVNHITLELGLRAWIMEQTPFTPGYVEQLYTFGNRGRVAMKGKEAKRVVSVGYLALTWCEEDQAERLVPWQSWYDFLPWEDWRQGRPEIIDNQILPSLQRWIDDADTRAEQEDRKRRCAACFAMRDDGASWDYEPVLERYELLYSARLVPEVFRDKGEQLPAIEDHRLVPGRSMRYDHRRILATAIGRLRGKIKYRPVIFELMPDNFTLLQLQKTIEAIGGYQLHKQNFRRLLENNRLVEETGEMSKKTGGRPAALFRFRKEILSERVAIGVKMSPSG